MGRSAEHRAVVIDRRGDVDSLRFGGLVVSLEQLPISGGKSSNGRGRKLHDWDWSPKSMAIADE